MAAFRFAFLAALLGCTSAFMLAPISLKLRTGVSVRARSSISRMTMQELEESKLFVGGIPWGMQSEDLRQAFSEFGEVMDANVVMDRETGRSKGFGFVLFAEKAQAEAACNQMNMAQIGGRTVSVTFAKARAPREGGFNRMPRE